MKTPVIGVFGGSFNPVHTGHMILASYLAQWGGMDSVVLMLSPSNPFKAGQPGIAGADHRLRMLRIAAGSNPFLRVSDIQLSLPTPSYTIDALDALAARFPDTQLRCIIGSDSWEGFSGWKDHSRIISDYGVVIYPRPGYDIGSSTLPSGVRLVDAPMVEISSTFIRKALAAGHDMDYFLPSGVFDYIKRHSLYGTFK